MAPGASMPAVAGHAEFGLKIAQAVKCLPRHDISVLWREGLKQRYVGSHAYVNNPAAV